MRSVVPFGAFVELLQQGSSGSNRHQHLRPFQALVHASAVSEETSRLSRDDGDEDKRRAIEFFAPVGSRVWVKIVEVKEEEQDHRSNRTAKKLKISASMRTVSQHDGTDLDPEGKTLFSDSRPAAGDARGGGDGGGGGKRGRRPLSPPGDSPLSPHPPARGTILRARVASTTKFGAFVLLEGFSGKALVHITQIAEGLDMARLKEATDEERESAVREMMPVGSDLLVKVVEVIDAREDEETGVFTPAKVSCSAKVVGQATGQDLDPTGERAGAGGKSGGAKAAAAAQAATAGAVARQGAAVEWGHLAAEKYKGASGKDYDLVQETPEEAAAAAAAAVAAEEAALRAEEELKRAAGGSGLPPPPPPPAITSVEAALAVLEQLGGGGGGQKYRRDKEKKDKKEKKKKKKRKKKLHRKEKRPSRSRRSRSGSSSSSSSSESE